MRWSHPTWCLVVALSVLATGAKVPRQIVYQIRPAPLSAFTSQDGTFLLDDGVTEFQFPTFGLKTGGGGGGENFGAKIPTAAAFVNTTPAEVYENESGSSSSASTSRSEEGSSAATREEITEVPTFGASKVEPVAQQFLQLQPEQIQQILQQLQSRPQQPLDVGPKYEYRSVEENNNNSEEIKAAQSEVITEDRLQSAYSERREKRKKKEPPMDASYAFGYETDEAARHEVADPNGNVKGWYTYVDDEGTVRKIIYTAGAGKGFVVLGKEKIKGPGAQAPPQRKHKQQQNNRVNTGDYGYAADTSTINSVRRQKPPTQQSFTDLYNSNNWNDLAKSGTSNPPIPAIIATQESPSRSRTKKPVFIVKIRRPVNKEQWPHLELFKLEADDHITSYQPPPPPPYLVKKGHHLSEPAPLPLPLKSRSRRKSLTLSDVVPSLRKRIKKYPTPPVYYADDDDESGDDSGNQGSYSASSSSEDDGSYRESSPEQQQQVQQVQRERGSSRGDGGSSSRSNGGGGGELPVKSDPDSSYVFGYETDTSNRLEKADPFGNVRGSYSYIGSSNNQLLSHHLLQEQNAKLSRRSSRKSKKSLKSVIDPEGVKRTVHYIAGGNTGFQVIHASPSITRGVRLEAPPGYVVKRVPSLRTAESRYPIPISVPQPSAIVYHIHPDSGWKPWEPTLRKKKVKIHRKRLPKAYFENPQREGLVLLQTHAEPSPPLSQATFFKEKITTAAGGISTTETNIPFVTMSPPIARRRHAPQRGYTGEHHLVQVDDDYSKEQIAATTYRQPKMKSISSPPPSPATSSYSSSSSSPMSHSSQPVHEREPLLYSPTFESMRDSGVSRSMPVVPNPIQLQPTQVAIKSRGAPTPSSPGLDTSSSNHHPVAFTSDGKLQVDVPTVVIEAIEAKSPSLKDENKNLLSHHYHHHHQQLPEAAAFTQQRIDATPLAQSSNNANVLKQATPTTPSYETAASPPNPTQVMQQQTYNANRVGGGGGHHGHHSNSNQQQHQIQVASSATPRTRRRHHRSKTPPTTPASAPPVSSSASYALKAGGGGGDANIETTTVMSSSKRLINRLAPVDHNGAQQQ